MPTVKHPMQQAQRMRRSRDIAAKILVKKIVIELGLGAGVGFLLGANTQRMRASLIATPVVKAFFNIAMSYFR
jgi:hypothetical protein